MNIGLHLIEDHYLPYPDDDFRMAADAGFGSIAFDFSLFLPKETGILSRFERKDHLLTLREKVACSFTASIESLKKHFLTYKSAAENKGLRFSQINAPYVSQFSEKMDYIKAVRNCIELCEWMESPFLIIHPFYDESLTDRQEKKNFDLFLSLAQVAREHHVTLCLESQYRKFNGRFARGFCSNAADTASLLDRLNEAAGEERFGFCLNTGIYNLFGQNLFETIIKLNRRIRTVCIHDNNGIWDQQCMPFTCTRNEPSPSTDWQGFVRGMRDIGFTGTLSFAAAGSVCSFPSNMRFFVLRMVGDTGRFMTEQLQIEELLKKCGQVVLFGAGNMFENYMSCYGDKYPPAFIADNNSRNWGTSKCGIPIKAPDTIKELTGNYGVFICNQFYYGIERQLQDMGVKNIYRFHDEYMPFRQNMEAK